MKRGGPLPRRIPLSPGGPIKPKRLTAVRSSFRPSVSRQTENQRLEIEADRLFGKLVRASGPCWAAETDGECLGPTQCAHLFSRRYHATRHDFANARPMCLGHHHWFTEHPLAWAIYCRERLGEDAYHALQQKAIHGEVPDLADVIARLRGAHG